MGGDGAVELADTTPEHHPVEVLCVDDDDSFARLTADALARHEDAVRTTVETDPTAALDRLTDDPDAFDGIVCDHDMPELTGLALLDELSARDVDIPFVLFTGEGSEEIASRAISAGVTDYVQKDGVAETFALVANRIRQAVERRRTERTLRRRERQFRRLVSIAPAPITMYDEHGEYVFANEAAADFFGYDSPAELIGQSKYDVASPAEHGQVKRRLAKLADGTEISTMKHSYVTADGSRRVGVASCTPATALNAAGITVIRGVSDEQDHAGRLDELARCLAHDLKTPLNVVGGRTELARETGDVSHLEESETALARVESYVDEVVQLLRSESRTPQFEHVDLARACRQTWSAVAPETASLVVTTDATVKADPTSLDRLLENLLSNAVEHGGSDVTVRVEGRSDGFSVSDDGPGVAPEARDRAFEPGYTTSADGTGFGLASVRQIALSHAWAVDLSESDAGGARFVITGVDRVDDADEASGAASSTTS